MSDPIVMEPIYARPADYDLEHEGDTADLRFYRSLVESTHATRVLELGSGTGRVALALAQQTSNPALQIVGIEQSQPMLAAARDKWEQLSPAARGRVAFVSGDVRQWHSEVRFDLVISPCSALCHLLELSEQIDVWTCTRRNLREGGLFVADVAMANLPVYAESLHAPPRFVLEIDGDTQDPESGARLLRYKTTQYAPHEQRARIRFVYDRFSDIQSSSPDRFVSDYDAHVYYPRELELLFQLTGFTVESRFGDYDGRSLAATSAQIIMVGRTGAAD